MVLKEGNAEIVNKTSGEFTTDFLRTGTNAIAAGREVESSGNIGEIPDGYPHAFDAAALAADFHSITTSPVTTFIKDAGESFVKYNKIVGGVGAIAGLDTVGVHLYNHHSTWKDAISGTLGLANLVLITIPGIGEAALGLELGVAAVTFGWDA